MDNDKHVDEAWKNAVAKDAAAEKECGDSCGCGHDHEGHDHGAPEVNFLNYIMSMGYQAMIFMGEVDHPATGARELNLPQSKFIIDTLAMLRDKTKGNLTPQEEQFFSGTLYELQMKFVEISGKPASGDAASGGSSIIL